MNRNQFIRNLFGGAAVAANLPVDKPDTGNTFTVDPMVSQAEAEKIVKYYHIIRKHTHGFSFDSCVVSAKKP